MSSIEDPPPLYLGSGEQILDQTYDRRNNSKSTPNVTRPQGVVVITYKSDDSVTKEENTPGTIESRQDSIKSSSTKGEDQDKYTVEKTSKVVGRRKTDRRDGESRAPSRTSFDIAIDNIPRDDNVKLQDIPINDIVDYNPIAR